MKTTLLMAITADGKIAKTADHFANWTSGADKKMFVEKTKAAGVIIMGLTTFQTIGRPLPGRLNVVLTPEPEKETDIPDSLKYTSQLPEEILKNLETRGYKEAIIGGGATINGLFLQKNLIDEIWLTIEPKIFGEGLNLFRGVDADVNLELLETVQLDKNVIQLKYKVIK
jgi:dihydrofolate reductase